MLKEIRALAQQSVDDNASDVTILSPQWRHYEHYVSERQPDKPLARMIHGDRTRCLEDQLITFHLNMVINPLLKNDKTLNTYIVRWKSMTILHAYIVKWGQNISKKLILVKTDFYFN